MKQKAIVVGAGIVGLATARALCLKNYDVTVIEKSNKAVGASIRNFGMVWPIGQPDGKLYNRSIRTKQIWKEIADSTNMWYDECGSIHLAYHQDEWEVLQEVNEIFSSNDRDVKLIPPQKIGENFLGINQTNLLGGLFSESEMIVNPVKAIPTVTKYLEEFLGVNFIWGKAITKIENNKVYSGNELFETDIVFVCTGQDFEFLFPELFSAQSITKSKLQMMRFTPDIADWRIKTSVCGGLSLIHYNSFKVAPSLQLLKERYEKEMPEYIKYGIHVMVSQNDQFELTVGDSHEYGTTFDPFDKVEINQLIFKYLNQFMFADFWSLKESWNGVYPKMTNGETELFLNPEPSVYILNGIGGVGMTLSFGLAEEMVASI